MENNDYGMIRKDEILIVVKDDLDNIYTRGWKKSAKYGQAIIWTLESNDIRYYLSGNIKSIKIVEG